MRPGLFAGGTIVFIWAFTDVGTPVILNLEHLIPVRIFKALSRGRKPVLGRTLLEIGLSHHVAVIESELK